MSLVVYADFSCPGCYVASHRADALRAAGVEVDWRAVEREPRLPVGGRRLSSSERDRLTKRFAALRGLLLPEETLPWVLPTITPNTQAAVSAYAEAYGAGVADDVRRLLFGLYWSDGADIGSPTVLRVPLIGPILRGNSDADPLRESGYAVSVDRGPITTAAYHRIQSWRAEWQELGSPGLPVVLRRVHADRPGCGASAGQGDHLRRGDSGARTRGSEALPAGQWAPAGVMGVPDRWPMATRISVDRRPLGRPVNHPIDVGAVMPDTDDGTTTPRRDITGRDDIAKLLTDFYGRAFGDDLLGRYLSTSPGWISPSICRSYATSGRPCFLAAGSTGATRCNPTCGCTRRLTSPQLISTAG